VGSGKTPLARAGVATATAAAMAQTGANPAHWETFTTNTITIARP
jgi:hypothetical protein